MRYSDLFEVFHTATDVVQMAKTEIAYLRKKYSAFRHTSYAYTVDIAGDRYAIFFSRGPFSELDEYSFNFAKIVEKDGKPSLTFEPTPSGSAFQVFSAVCQTLETFVAKYKPKLIDCIGYTRRQSALYAKMAPHLIGRLPDYRVNNSGSIVTLQRTLSESGGLVVQGVNTTPDVQPGEIARQAAKFGNIVDANGLPPVWTGLASSTGAKDTPNKGDPFYGKDGTPPNRSAPRIIKEMKTTKARHSTVYINPSPSELSQLAKIDLRGLVDGNDVYLWYAEEEIHARMAEMLGIDYSKSVSIYVISNSPDRHPADAQEWLPGGRYYYEDVRTIPVGDIRVSIGGKADLVANSRGFMRMIGRTTSLDLAA